MLAGKHTCVFAFDDGARIDLADIMSMQHTLSRRAVAMSLFHAQDADADDGMDDGSGVRGGSVEPANGDDSFEGGDNEGGGAAIVGTCE